MGRRIESNLRSGGARVGATVMCISLPDMSDWKKVDGKDPDFILPKLNAKYKIRANVFGATFQGIKLEGIENKKCYHKNAGTHGITLEEPVFPYSSFILLGQS